MRTINVYPKRNRFMRVIAPLAFIIWVVASWITHIVVCLQNESWGFLIAGALLLPIAWIHGTGIWFGWF
jgi:hypothetical protein